MKTQPALQANLSQQLSKTISEDMAPSNDAINFITFNQDALCIALAMANGFKIFNCKPHFGKCFQFKKNESMGIIEMLYTSSLLAVVSLGEEAGNSPKKLKILNIKRQSTICDLIFPSTILTVKLTKHHLVVLLEDQIYIYDISNMHLLHTIETSPNPNGLCTVSLEPNNGSYYLAYPSSPKTIAHDSLLLNGINTNGGPNSVQNNIQSVSNSPNRGISDVIIFNLTKLQPTSVIEAHKLTLAAMTLSSNGKLLATASDKGTIVRVFSVETGVKLYQFRRGTYPTHIYSLSFSFDDKYVIATSSSETVHIFRLGHEEALVNKLRKTPVKRMNRRLAEEESIKEEEEEDDDSGKKSSDESLRDDGDDSDAEVGDGDDGDDDDDMVQQSGIKQRKLSQDSSHSFCSVNSGFSMEDIAHPRGMGESPNAPAKSEPIVDQNRLSVARLIRRSSQTLGRKAAQKMGEFLPSRFSSILEPTRHFASLKINTVGKGVKSIAVMNSDLTENMVPQSYFKETSGSGSFGSTPEENFMSLKLLHINVVTSEGYFYTYGLDPERGGDCILLNQYSLLETDDVKR